jgi:FkbM family methyltransferase
MTISPRSALERMLRDTTMRRHLPKEFGRAPIIMSAAGGLGALLRPVRKYDPLLLRIALSLVHPGNVVWDVGANIGLFSVASAALSGASGNVIAFEPDVVLVNLLRRTASLQSRSAAPITIVPSGVAREQGLRSFSIAKRARASNALSDYGNSQMGGVAEIQTVVVFALDDLVRWLPPPNVIKIDVEGAEIEVLAGARELLHQRRPSIVCEVAGGNAPGVTKLLADIGYQLYDGSRPLSAASRCVDATWTTIALPLDR